MTDTTIWDANARGLKWNRTKSGNVAPVNASGKRVNVSHSTLDTMDRCKLRAWFDKVGCVPRVPKEAPDRGTRIHALLEEYGKRGEFPGDDFTVELKDHKGEKVHVKPTKLDRLCASVAQDYVPLEAGVLHEEGVFLNDVFTDGKGATCGFSGKIDVFDPQGTLSRGDYYARFKAPSGGLIEGPGIIDYKTRGSFSYAPGVDQLGYNKQLARYVVAGMIGSPSSPSWGADSVPDEVIVAHVNIGTRKIETMGIAAVMKRDIVEAVWEQTIQGAVQLLDLCRIDRVSDVPYNKGSCRDFGGCDHANICPHSHSNSTSKGRIGALFGLTQTPSTSTGKTKEDHTVAKMNLKKLRKGKTTTPTTPAPTTEAKPKVSFKKEGGLFGKKHQASRTQTPDAGPVRSMGKKDVQGEPLVNDALLKDVVRLAKATASNNKQPLSSLHVKFACEEVGLDYTAAEAALSELLPEAMDAPAPEPQPEPQPEPAASVPSIEGADAEVLALIETLASDVPVYKANLAAYKYLLRWDGQATLDRVRDRAKAAYNEDADKPIKRWTHVADNKVLSKEVFAWDGTDATTVVTLRTDEATPEPVAEVEAPVAPTQSPAPIDFIAQAIAQGRPVTVATPDGKATVVPGELEDSAPTPAPAVPAIYVDCFPVQEDVVDFDQWLAPYCKMVETAESVHFWGAVEFNKGPGLVANNVARHIASTGNVGEVFPAALRVDSRHKAWHMVRAVLYSLPQGSLRLVEGVK